MSNPWGSFWLFGTTSLYIGCINLLLITHTATYLNTDYSLPENMKYDIHFFARPGAFYINRV